MNQYSWNFQVGSELVEVDFLRSDETFVPVVAATGAGARY